jgi:hypothetical protein
MVLQAHARTPTNGVSLVPAPPVARWTLHTAGQHAALSPAGAPRRRGPLRAWLVANALHGLWEAAGEPPADLHRGTSGQWKACEISCGPGAD